MKAPPNRLARETSRYLLQHSHNPVDWYPWGDEAIAAAKDGNKPIFLSIGYSACHWCHVMERESFEDPDTARLLNSEFIAIKVDREERPDLDTVYMTAVQMLTGGGGWPMSVFLTPDLQPFYGGTYFPPESRHGLPAFKTVLTKVAEAWRDRRNDLDASASELTAALSGLDRGQGEAVDDNADAVHEALKQMRATFDSAHGGFGRAPKFPPCGQLSLILRLPGKGGSDLLDMVTLTLDRMASGGIFDHVGGGFHRYSVDREWLVPHFEKMLYDNALIASLYLDAFLSNGKSLYRRIAADTLSFVAADMTGPDGPFFASLDADSEGEEGIYYAWSLDDFQAAIGSADAEAAASYLGVTAAGHFEHGNVLHTDAREDTDLSRVAGWRARLLEARRRRVPPAADTKVIASWNGFMISAFTKGYRVLGDNKWRNAAEKAARFVSANMIAGETLAGTWAGGRAGKPGFLDDYAAMACAILDLYEATFRIEWLDLADKLTNAMLKRFGSDDRAGLYFAAEGDPHLIVRPRSFDDGPTPSGNAMAALVLLRLARLLDRSDYRTAANDILRAAGAVVARFPTACSGILAAAAFAKVEPIDIVIAGNPDEPSARKLLDEVNAVFLPSATLACADPAAADFASIVRRIPLLEGKTRQHGHATAYACIGRTCKAPVSDPKELRTILAALRASSC